MIRRSITQSRDADTTTLSMILRHSASTGSAACAFATEQTSVSEILLFQNPQVMLNVTRNDEGQRTDCKRLSAGNSLPHPCIFGEIAIERYGPNPHALEFFYVSTPRDIVRFCA